MYDCNKEINDFFESDIRMTNADKEKVISAKSTNIEFLKEGLSKLRKNDATVPCVREDVIQGSRAMHTMIHDAKGEYDIDVAIVFDKGDLDSMNGKIKDVVLDALNQSGRNFNTPPEIRKNAVTVWYEEGYHIDFAIYRKFYESGKQKYEHLGEEWKKRDPRRYTEWFNNEVATRCPKENDGQLRKIVMLFKYFCRSRIGWSLPGGIILTTLATKFYFPNTNRDDFAFYETVKKIHEHLKYNLIVYNESDDERPPLVVSEKDKKKVERLRDKLADFLPKLDVLSAWDCDKKKALSAWGDFFNHDFSEDIKESANSLRSALFSNNAALTRKMGFELIAGVARNEDGIIYKDNLISDGKSFHKGLWIRFKLTGYENAPVSIKWIVENSGDEAEENNCLRYEIEKKSRFQWRLLSFRGRHKMICIVNHPDCREPIRLEYIVNIA